MRVRIAPLTFPAARLSSVVLVRPLSFIPATAGTRMPRGAARTVSARTVRCTAGGFTTVQAPTPQTDSHALRNPAARAPMVELTRIRAPGSSRGGWGRVRARASAPAQVHASAPPRARRCVGVKRAPRCCATSSASPRSAPARRRFGGGGAAARLKVRAGWDRPGMSDGAAGGSAASRLRRAFNALTTPRRPGCTRRKRFAGGSLGAQAMDAGSWKKKPTQRWLPASE